MNKLCPLRVSQLVNGCDRVNPSLTDSDTVFFMVTRMTLLPQNLMHQTPGGDTALKMQPQWHLLGCPCPPLVPHPREMPRSEFSKGFPSRAEAMLYFLSQLVVLMEGQCTYCQNTEQCMFPR